MKLDIITPKKMLFSGEVESVTLPGTMGSFTVLEGHAPLISSLQPKGKIIYTQDSKKETLPIPRGGFVEVKKNHIIVLA
ncbi:MAG: ATP synthase F1 subunit epsilon [Bacteroidales bacterium]|nr:ATP synthase F1 subunit epsilon [Bacteroidales bacterium]MCL2132744.1 ATP synthase F1 subunit epsilon [Bacteroidales bacterium]